MNTSKIKYVCSRVTWGKYMMKDLMPEFASAVKIFYEDAKYDSISAKELAEFILKNSKGKIKMTPPVVGLFRKLCGLKSVSVFARTNILLDEKAYNLFTYVFDNYCDELTGEKYPDCN